MEVARHLSGHVGVARHLSGHVGVARHLSGQSIKAGLPLSLADGQRRRQRPVNCIVQS